MKDLFEMLGVLLVGSIFFMVLVCVPVVVIGSYLDSKTCEAKGVAMGFPHQWDFWKDCMIQVDNKWIPLRSYMVVKEQKSKI